MARHQYLWFDWLEFENICFETFVTDRTESIIGRSLRLQHSEVSGYCTVDVVWKVPHI